MRHPGGELLALTPADFDLAKGLLSITKSYQRLKGRDVITDPKTPKSVRVIQMPQFLTDEIRDYLKSLYKVQPDQRIFEVTKSYLHHEMDRGAKEAGVKPGEALAYLIAPPLEGMYAMDAALKAAEVRLCKLYAPPSETNFGGGLLTGTQSACDAACAAFAAAVTEVAAQPMERM